MKQYTLNFQDDTDLDGEMMTSSSPEDSPANLTAKPEEDWGRKTSDISGRKCLESFQRLSQPTSWGKMFMDSLIGTKVWSSKKCVLTWRILGTQYNRYYCQLRASVRLTTECESGLLLTPMAQAFEQVNTEAYNARMERIIAKGHKPFTMPLDQMAIRGMLPTPSAMDYVSARTPETFQKAKERHAAKGVNLQMPLKQMARNGILPTPTTRDCKSGVSPNGMIGKHRSQTGTISHQLNPQFVAEMMGFPTDWTELPFLSGDNNP